MRADRETCPLDDGVGRCRLVSVDQRYSWETLFFQGEFDRLPADDRSLPLHVEASHVPQGLLLQNCSGHETRCVEAFGRVFFERLEDSHSNLFG